MPGSAPHLPGRTTGVVIDLVEGRTRCEVEVSDPPDASTVALDDLAPCDDT